MCTMCCKVVNNLLSPFGVVSYKLKLVFVKSRKTAGTSSEAFIQQALRGGGVTHEQGWEIYRDGICTPRLSIERPSVLQRLKIVAAGRLPWKSFGRVVHLRNHSAPEQIRDALGSKFWENSTKIINVRNPFDQVLSRFFIQTAQMGGTSNRACSSMRINVFPLFR